MGSRPIAIERQLRHAGLEREEKKMSTSIVCGLDGSPDSRAALEVAARLSARLKTRLVLAHVAELAHVPYAAAYPFGGTAGPTTFATEVDAEEEAGERLLEQVSAAAGLTDAERRVEIGVPAERLAELADEEDAELIVVGSRGRGAFRAAFLGSVSSSLVGVARCPVLIVPPGASQAQ
jgi:nucleotide-binding universal stress UspA family protein